MQARSAARIASRALGFVEEELRAELAVRPVVEGALRAGREPLSKPEDGHELVVVLLGRGEIRNADPDVVDEAGSRQRATSAVVNGSSLGASVRECARDER
jgi:hypothetical protein